MPLDHNQWAVVAIVSTLCLAGAYTVVDSGISTTEIGGYEPASNDLIFNEESTFEKGTDEDEDGISDRMEETLYGTDWRNPDTDGDGLSDGWEIANGLDPLDDGTASNDRLLEVVLMLPMMMTKNKMKHFLTLTMALMEILIEMD